MSRLRHTFVGIRSNVYSELRQIRESGEFASKPTCLHGHIDECTEEPHGTDKLRWSRQSPCDGNAEDTTDAGTRTSGKKRFLCPGTPVK